MRSTLFASRASRAGRVVAHAVVGAVREDRSRPRVSGRRAFASGFAAMAFAMAFGSSRSGGIGPMMP